MFFFLPALATIVGCLIYKLFYSSNIEFGMDIVYGVSYDIVYETYITLIAFPPVATFLIGWLVLLTLNNRNKSAKIDENQITPPKVIRPHLLHGLYSSNTKFRYTVIYISVFAIIISIISCFFINYGYLTYHLPESVFSEFPEVSFEYPANHYEPVYHRWKFIHGENQTMNKRIQLYSALENGTYSHIYISCSNQTLDMWGGTDAYKDILLKSFDNPANRQQIVYDTVLVGSITAYQLIISVESYYGDGNDWGTHIYVFFDHHEISWHISYSSWNSETLQPPPFFTHLLETFKIEE